MQNKTQLKVMQGQIGSLWWAHGLANTIWQLILQQNIVNGLYHWADSGTCSRYEFASAIQAITSDVGLLTTKVEIEAVNFELFDNTAARRAFSTLDSTLFRDKLSLPQVPLQQHLVQALKLFLPAQIKKDE